MSDMAKGLNELHKVYRKITIGISMKRILPFFFIEKHVRRQ